MRRCVGPLLCAALLCAVAPVSAFPVPAFISSLRTLWSSSRSAALSAVSPATQAKLKPVGVTPRSTVGQYMLLGNYAPHLLGNSPSRLCLAPQFAPWSFEAKDPLQQIPPELVPHVTFKKAVAAANIEADEYLTEWLVAVNAAANDKCQPRTLSDKVQVVELNTTYDLVASGEPDEPGAVSAIFIRESYPQLFDAIWNRNKVALIGNPGTGKSYLQPYFIYRLLKDPAARGNIKVVIRQVAGVGGSVEVFLLDELKAYRAEPRSVRGFLTSFKPKECLYLFEPNGDKETEPQAIGGLKTIATVSPYARRVKEFLKTGGAQPLYMPLWNEAELLAVANYVRNLDSTKGNNELQSMYSDAAVKARFAMYGGIFRYVLPTDPYDLSKNERKYKEAMDALGNNPNTLAKITKSTDDREDNVSHFYLQYVVSDDFEDFSLHVIGEQAVAAMEQSVEEANYFALRDMLRSCNEGVLPDRARRGLERIAPLIWCRDAVNWIRVDKTRGIELPQKLEADTTLHAEDLQDWKKMRPGVIYSPGLVNFPFVEGVFRTVRSPGVLQAYQSKSGDCAKLANVSAAHKLRERLGMKPTDRMHVWYIVLPRASSEWHDKIMKANPWAALKGEAKRLPAQEVKDIKKHTTFGVLTHDFKKIVATSAAEAAEAAEAASPSAKPSKRA